MQEIAVLLGGQEEKSMRGYKVGDMFLLQSGLLAYDTPNLRFYTTPETDEGRADSIITNRNEQTSAVYVNKQHLNKVLVGHFDTRVEAIFTAINTKKASLQDVKTQMEIIDACVEAFGTPYLTRWIMAQANAFFNRTSLEYLIRLVNGFVKYDPSVVKKESWVRLVRYNESSCISNIHEVRAELKKLNDLLAKEELTTIGCLFRHLVNDRGTDEALMDILYMCKTIFGYKQSLVDVV